MYFSRIGQSTYSKQLWKTEMNIPQDGEDILLIVKKAHVLELMDTCVYGGYTRELQTAIGSICIYLHTRGRGYIPV